jgi:site-specific DNA-methyltransferase (adenine-specific)
MKLELNKIHCMGCLDGLNLLEDNSVDLVFTSPPYNMRLRIRNGKYTEREKAEHFSKKYDYFNDALPLNDFYDFHKKVLKELLRVSKVVCYNFQIVTGSKEAFFKIIGDFNQQIKDVLIWDKGHGQPAMNEKVTNSCYEFILVLESDEKKGRMIRNATFERGKFNNILRVGRSRSISNSHGAVFPIKLAQEIISNFSNKTDLVLDPFMGSGTTAVACKQLGREFIGFEICEEYCKIANKRLEQANLNTFFENKEVE